MSARDTAQTPAANPPTNPPVTTSQSSPVSSSQVPQTFYLRIDLNTVALNRLLMPLVVIWPEERITLADRQVGTIGWAKRIGDHAWAQITITDPIGLLKIPDLERAGICLTEAQFQQEHPNQ